MGALRLSLLPWLAAVLVSCGGAEAAQPAHPAADAPEAEPAAEAPSLPPMDGQGGEGVAEGPVEWAPLGDLPRAAEPEPEPRPEPDIGSLDEARQAFAKGFYEAVDAYLRAHSRVAKRPAGRLLHGRLAQITGRYEQAAGHARAAARDRSLRVAARTLEGEAWAARGRLRKAEKAFRAVAEEPPAHRARVMLGRLLARQGRGSDARRWFYRLIDAYNDETIGLDEAEGLTYVGLAAWGLGAYQDANQAFQEATKADPDRVDTQLWWARLFLEKYDTGHAEESVTHALERNPEHPVARALLARIRIEQRFDFEAASRQLDRAQEVNPNLPMAHVTRAGMALRDGAFDRAGAHLDEALAVDPNDLEALSVRAAAALIAADERAFARAEKAVLDRNPEFADMYTIIADYADWEHRYREIVELARKAVRIDPSNGLAHATLGLNLMRTGEEKEGLRELHEAWRRDRFNVQVFNTLNLYDDVIPKEYEDVRSGPFAFRMHREERPMLERYTPKLLAGAYRDMVRRYGFTPDGPVRIEMYGDPEHFAVRTTGLPRLGVQGVCFGRVITAISPRGGPFNWGQITWHELAHVFHLQLSKNRVPRWFTEGLAEYETIIARPEWKREMDHMLWQALDAGRLPELALMNRAFTHARSAEEMITAYYTSSQAVKFIVERYGMPKVVRMLRAWGRGESTAEVVRGVLGIDLAGLDRQFREHTRERLAKRANDFTVDFQRYEDLDALEQAARARSDDPDARAALAVGLAVHGEPKRATDLARQVIGRAPKHPLARFLLARLALARRKPGAAEKHLKAILAGGVDGYDVRLFLARAAGARQDVAAMRKHLEAATGIDRDRPEAWLGLAGVAGKQNDTDLRVRALRRLVGIDEHARAPMAALLPLLAERGAWDELAGLGEQAVMVDPHAVGSHRWYAEALVRTGKPKKALFELESAFVAEPEKPGPVHLARARALMALGRRAEARRAADEAVQADDSLAEEAEAILRGR